MAQKKKLAQVCKKNKIMKNGLDNLGNREGDRCRRRKLGEKTRSLNRDASANDNNKKR